MKMSPKIKYAAVAIVVVVVLTLIIVGSFTMPKETENVTSSTYGKTMQLGEYTFAVSDAKYDTYTKSLLVNLYHMTSEPKSEVGSPYFVLAYANEDKNLNLTYTIQKIDDNTDQLTITDVPSDYTSLDIELLTQDAKAALQTISVSVDKWNIRTVDSSTYVYVYVTPTNTPTP